MYKNVLYIEKNNLTSHPLDAPVPKCADLHILAGAGNSGLDAIVFLGLRLALLGASGGTVPEYMNVWSFTVSLPDLLVRRKSEAEGTHCIPE